jgi:hypothetical protein
MTGLDTRDEPSWVPGGSRLGQSADPTTEVVIRAGALQVPDPRDYRDAFIGATALVHGLTLVTRNVSRFAPMGVPLVNPFA